MINRELVEKALRLHTVTVKFLKVGGDIRAMKCTLNPTIIPTPKKNARTITRNPDICRVWDIEASAWRSFHYDAIYSMDVQ
jgi:hypothetical protein